MFDALSQPGMRVKNRSAEIRGGSRGERDGLLTSFDQGFDDDVQKKRRTQKEPIDLGHINVSQDQRNLPPSLRSCADSEAHRVMIIPPK